MRASTLFLGFTLVVLAAVLAGLWQTFGPRSAPPRPAATSAPVAEAPRRPPPAPPPVQPAPSQQDDGVRSVYPGARPSAARAPQPESPPPTTAALPPPAPEPAPAAPIALLPAPEQSAALRPPGAVPPAESGPADASAVGEGIDLNTASVDTLNNLGAGKIGKTIIANRPYTSPEDLLTRRVLKRKDYDAIKARIVVR